LPWLPSDRYTLRALYSTTKALAQTHECVFMRH
jgi:hypothetical protein